MMRWLAAALLGFSLAANDASAQSAPESHAVCFNSAGSIVAPDDRPDCHGDFQSPRIGVIARDLETGNPLYEVYTDGKKTKGKTKTLMVGLKDGAGNIIVPASAGMMSFVPLTDDLVYAKQTWEHTFFVRVSDGKIRPVPYSHVLPLPNNSGPPLLLARDFRRATPTSNIAWILDPSGEETGGKIDNIAMPGYLDIGMFHNMPTIVSGLIQYHDPTGPAFIFSYATALGETVAPGKAIYANDIGVVAPVGTGPRHPGHAGDPVYYGVVAPSGGILPLAPDTKGLTKLWHDWYIVREQDNRLTFERAWRPGGPPDLSGPPINKVFDDIAAERFWVMGKTPAGWLEISGPWVGARLFATAEDGIAAREAGWQAILAEEEAERQRQASAAKAARDVAVAQLRDAVERAKTYTPSEWELEGLYMRMNFLQVTNSEIDITGLPALPTPQERFCRLQPGGQCRGPRGEASPGPSSSQWAGSSFDAMQYLRDQYTSNCAAASMGADRPCWTP